MWELDYKERWALNNWCFWTVVLQKTLEGPVDSRRSNWSIINEISLEYSLEGLMLKLKLQYFGHLMQRADSFEKTLMLGKIEGRRRGDDRGWDSWMASPFHWTWVWVDSRSWWWIGSSGMLQFMGSQRVRHDWATELNWNIANFLSKGRINVHVHQHRVRVLVSSHWPEAVYEQTLKKKNFFFTYLWNGSFWGALM